MQAGLGAGWRGDAEVASDLDKRRARADSRLVMLASNEVNGLYEAVSRTTAGVVNI